MGHQALTTRAALLQELLLDGEGCGGKLRDRVRKRTGVQLLHGALFPALRGLKSDGLTESWEKRGMPGKDQVWYRLTSAGRQMAWEHRMVMRKFLEETQDR